MNPARWLILILVLSFVWLHGCGEKTEEPLEPTEAYRDFFTELGKGNTSKALEGLAPEGALGDTFRGGSYYMMARNVEQQLEDHGDLREIIIDREDVWGEDEVMVDGRLVFADGKEMPVGIRFTREKERWVGQL